MDSIEKIKSALRILDIWLRASKHAKARGNIGRLYAIRFRAVAFINHDRLLTNRPLLNPVFFRTQPGRDQ